MIAFIQKPKFAAYDIFSLAGYIPSFLSEDDPRSAAEQIAAEYVGGWSKFDGFKMIDESLKYPGDPALQPLAEGWLRDEHILVYESAWVAIVQKDGSFEVARLD